MKNRTEKKWSKNDNWETPNYILNYIKKEFFDNRDFFDPCPLSKKIWDEYILEFDWLNIEWEDRNFVNPPYNITDKPKFVKKAYEEYLKWRISVLLIPATTETKWFHEFLVPYAWIFFIKWRIKFKWYNSKNEYVTNKSWQSGSILCILDPRYKAFMTDLDFDKI